MQTHVYTCTKTGSCWGGSETQGPAGGGAFADEYKRASPAQVKMPKAEKIKKLRRWAFTRWLDEDQLSNIPKSVTELKKLLNRTCRRWTFQLEKGPTCGKLHFQGRLSWKDPKRPSECAKIYKAHYGAEVDEDASEFYCLKEDREQGPWSDKDVALYKPECYDKTLNEFQELLMAKLDMQTSRRILLVVDPKGERGKTTLVMKLVCERKALKVPAIMEKPEDMCQFLYPLMKPGEKHTIFMDVPRFLCDNSAWRRFLIFVEEFKTGFVYDKRYKGGQFKIIDPPRICITCNGIPKEVRKFIPKNKFDIWDCQ